MNATRVGIGGHKGRASLSGPALVLVALSSLVYFLDGLVHSILGPLAPEIGRALHLSKADLGPVFSANLLGQCVGLVLIPLLVPRFGNRAVVAFSLVGFGIMQTGTSFAFDRDSLVLLRVVTGFFLGGALPSCFALVAAGTPPERKGLAIAILFTGYGLGTVIAGLIASVFTGPHGWRVAMIAIGAICIVTAVIAWWFLEDTVNRERTGVIARDDGRALDLLSKDYRVGTLLLWTIFVAMLIINYCLTSWLPTLLVDVGRDKSFAALAVSIFAGGGLIATFLIGPVIDRFGVWGVLVSFLLISTATLFIVGQVLQTAPPMALLAMLATSGFFCLGSYSGVNVLLANFYPAPLRAVGVGFTKSVGRLGTVIAPVMIGIGLTRGVSEETMMSLFALPAVLTTLAVVLLGRSRKGLG
jgi:MFS family permease